MILAQAIHWGAARVRYISPRLGAELLAGRVLGWSRPAVLTHPERELTAEEWATYTDLVERCAQGEPLFYLLGEREFYGLPFQVDRRVLIPRPETERLVEHALAWLDAYPGRQRVIDVGTGSGCIAVTLAVQWPGLRVEATDVSADALEVARANAIRHGVAERVSLERRDLLAGLPEPVDLIVANLPYVSQAEWPELETPVAEYEPMVALHGGEDGLGLIRRLLDQAPTHLRSGGAILLEIGYAQAAAVQALASAAFPQAKITVHRDLAGLDRIVEVQT